MIDNYSTDPEMRRAEMAISKLKGQVSALIAVVKMQGEDIEQLKSAIKAHGIQLESTPTGSN